MDNYIVINGKKTELTSEQLEKLEKLGIKPDTDGEAFFKRTPDGVYYFINNDGDVEYDTDDNWDVDNARFKVSNYCTDEGVMKQRALHETLNRLLWKASVIAGELDNPWNGHPKHYSIYRNDMGSFIVACLCNDHYNEIYFPSAESANDAIHNIIEPFMKEHPDFVW